MTAERSVAKKLKGQDDESKTVRIVRLDEINTVISTFLAMRINPS